MPPSTAPLSWFMRQHLRLSVVAGVVIALLLSYFALIQQLDYREHLFGVHAQRIRASLLQQLSIAETSAQSLQAFYHATDDVQQDEFDTFVSTLRQHYAFISACLFYQHVRSDERAAFEQWLQASQMPARHIFGLLGPGTYPREERSEYYPISRLHPLTPFSATYIGMDLLHFRDSKLHSAARHAVGTGVLEMVEPYPQRNEEDTETLFRVSIFVPVYRSNQVPVQALDRQRDIEGIASISLRPDLLLSSIELPPSLRVQFTIGRDDAQLNPYGSFYWGDEGSADRIARALQFQHELTLAGMPIYIRVTENVYWNQINYLPLLIVFYLSLAFALMLYQMLRAIINASAARVANQAKNEFIATVSHELRTPLTSIHGSLGLIEGGASGEITPLTRQLIEIASKNCTRLVRLINDILDIEKIESGNIALQREHHNLSAILQEAITSNDSYAEKYGVHFVLKPLPAEIPVLIDHDRLLQVMDNLLSNAAKFSPAGAEIHISAAVDRATVQVSVRDFGTGIAPDFQPRLFNKFAQADASDSREKGGTGLGLSICKAIIEMHDGHIGYETAPQKGSTFWFELPLSKTPSPNAIPMPMAATAQERRDSSTAGDDSPQRILHVEDNADLCALVRQLIDGQREIDSASSLAAARELLQQHRYATVLLDIGLPDGSGLDLIALVRRHQPQARIIVFSGQDIDEPWRRDVDAVIVKSRHDVQKLAEAISSTLCDRTLSSPRHG